MAHFTFTLVQTLSKNRTHCKISGMDTGSPFSVLQQHCKLKLHVDDDDICLTATFPDNPGRPVPEWLLHSRFYCNKDDGTWKWWWQLKMWMLNGWIDAQSSSKIATTHKPTPNFLQTGCPSCRSTNSVRALKGESITFHGFCSPRAHLGVFNRFFDH